MLLDGGSQAAQGSPRKDRGRDGNHPGKTFLGKMKAAVPNWYLAAWLIKFLDSSSEL